MLASGLNNPTSLIVVGSTLFWVENQGQSGAPTSTISSIPIAGGTKSTVVTKSGLDGNLVSDGTSLYYTWTNETTSVTELDKASLTGSSITPLATTLDTGGAANTNELFVEGTNLYVQSSAAGGGIVNIYSVPTAGGSPTAALTLGTGDDVNLFLAADPAHLLFLEVALNASTGVSALDLIDTSLGGAGAVTLNTQAVGSQTANMLKGVIVGTNAVFLSSDTTASSMLVSQVALAGGTPQTIGTFANTESQYLAADANGIYIDQEVASNGPGIYSISSSGTETLFRSAPTSSVTTGLARGMALDTANVYWFEGGNNPGQGSVHKQGR